MCCDFTDYCEDTPEVNAPLGCISDEASICNSNTVEISVPFHNIMDYSDCMTEFTPDQMERINIVWTEHPVLSLLSLSTVCRKALEISDYSIYYNNGLLGHGVDITVEGGLPPYSFLWTGPNGFISTQQNISNIEYGTYKVVLTDSQGQEVDRKFKVCLLFPFCPQQTSDDILAD